MDVLDAIKGRRSIRSYTPEDVSDEQIDSLLGYAMMAPSARNLQPWHLCVVRDAALRQRMSAGVRAAMLEAAPEEEPLEDCLYGAPVAVLVCAQEESKWSRADCGMLTQNMLLAAHAMGLGTCVIGFVSLAFGRDATLRDALCVPEGYAPLYAVTIGHPAQGAEAKARDLGKVTYVKGTGAAGGSRG